MLIFFQEKATESTQAARVDRLAGTGEEEGKEDEEEEKAEDEDDFIDADMKATRDILMVMDEKRAQIMLAQQEMFFRRQGWLLKILPYFDPIMDQLLEYFYHI